MELQIYTCKTLALFASKMLEDGFGPCVSEYETDELIEMLKEETNEHAKHWLNKLIGLWPQAMEAWRIMDDEIAGCWDEDDFQTREFPEDADEDGEDGPVK